MIECHDFLSLKDQVDRFNFNLGGEGGFSFFAQLLAIKLLKDQGMALVHLFCLVLLPCPVYPERVKCVCIHPMGHKNTPPPCTLKHYGIGKLIYFLESSGSVGEIKSFFTFSVGDRC